MQDDRLSVAAVVFDVDAATIQCVGRVRHVSLLWSPRPNRTPARSEALGRSSQNFYSTHFGVEGQEQGPGRSIGPGPMCFSGSVSDSLGRYLLFIPRQHPLGGLGLHVRNHRAIWGDVIIVARTIRIGA